MCFFAMFLAGDTSYDEYMLLLEITFGENFTNEVEEAIRLDDSEN